MSKNRSFKRGLTLVLALFILCALLAIPCFAQAPIFDRENYPQTECILYAYYNDGSSDWTYYPVYIIDVCNWDYSVSSTPTGDVSVVLTERYYTLYGNDSDTIYSLECYVFARMFTPQYAEFNDTGITLNEMSENGYFPLAETSLLTSAVSSAFENQFTYWENENQTQYENGFSAGQNEGFTEGKNEGYSEGYTTALEDVDAFERAFVTIFNAPFDFLSNLSDVQLFGVSIFDVVGVILVLALGYLLLRFIGGAIPL